MCSVSKFEHNESVRLCNENAYLALLIFYSYRSANCPGRLIRNLESNEFTATNTHSHAADAREAKSAVVVKKVKRLAAKHPSEPGRNIKAKVTKRLDVATLANLKSTRNLLRTVRNARMNEHLPPIPKNASELVLSDKFTKYKDEPFLLYYSGPSENRILMFTTKRNLNLLKDAELWQDDGTFDITSPMFTHPGKKVPLVYTLATKIFEQIAKHAPTANPKYIISDFEIGAIGAIQAQFIPNAKLHGCFYHLCQSVWRQLQALGLHTKYNTDAQFALHVREILALAFVPSNEIPGKFAELCESDFWSNEDNDDYGKLQSLLNYFESTYVGVETRAKSRRRVALFPPAMWSVYEVTKLSKPEVLVLM